MPPITTKFVDRLASFQRSLVIWLYIVVLAPSAAAVSILSPPLAAPDEANHLARAVAVSTGHAFAARLPGGAGAVIDRSNTVFKAEIGRELVFGRPLDEALRQRAWGLRLEGVTAEVLLPNTGIYPALLYIPQALGIRIAAMFSDRVYIRLVCSRVVNGLVAMAILALAIWLFPPAAPALLMTATLPMTLFL